MANPDPDAVMVQAVLRASDQPLTTELLISAAKAYEALRSSRERETSRRHAECPHLADVLAGRSDRAHDDSNCGWCADIRNQTRW